MGDSSPPDGPPGTTGAGIVNVCGCGSSGTTMLAHALDRHPEIACGDELFLFCAPELYRDYAAFRSHRRLYRLIGVSGNPYHQGRAIFRQAGAYGLGRSDLWRMAGASASINALAARVQAHVAARTGKRLWAEKTPRNVRVIDLFVRAFPQARVIHLVRDPRDVLLSLCRRGKSLLDAAETWLASAAAIAPHRVGGQVLDVRYEDLCADPERALARIAAFLEVRFEPRYFATDEFASQGLGKFKGHASWSLSPEQGFNTASIGRHRAVDFDWDALGHLRLTAGYARLLNTRQWRLAELAREFGYDMADAAPGALAPPYRTFANEWRLDPVRRRLDASLGLPRYMPMVEYQQLPDHAALHRG